MAFRLLRRPRVVHLSHHRHQAAFSTTTPRHVSLQLDRNDPSAVADVVPSYPYGPARWYKQSDLGLYGGRRIRFGNNTAEEYRTRIRRSWKPNVLTRRLFSRALNRFVQVRVAARTLRTIDKLGGLDEYLLGEKETRIRELGLSGWWLRWAIMQTEQVQRRFEAERGRLGVPELREEVAAMEKMVEGTEAETVAKPVSEGEETFEDELPTDDAFTLAPDPALAPLKFRVGPGQHLLLTPDGWRRTRPGTDRAVSRKKARIVASHFPTLLDDRMRLFHDAFRQHQQERHPRHQRHPHQKQNPPLATPPPLVATLARRAFRRDLDAGVEGVMEEKRRRREEATAIARRKRAMKKAGADSARTRLDKRGGGEAIEA